MRVLVVYDTKYGNTRLVAEKIVQGIREIAGTETAMTYVKDAKPERFVGYDALPLGAPTHWGRLQGS